MRAWLAAALVFLLAVPFHPCWQDFEVARRGLLCCLTGLLCIVPGALPERTPLQAAPLFALAGWWVLRSIGVDNPGYGLELAACTLALGVLVAFGSGAPARLLLRAAVPAGLVVAGWTFAQWLGLEALPGAKQLTSTLGNRNVASEFLAVAGAAAALLAATAGVGRRERWLALGTVALCALAVGLNGSRSGLVALPLGCAPLLLRRAFLPVAAALSGLAIAWLLPPAAAGPENTAVDQTAAYSTLAVRRELWTAGCAMVADRPLLGHGAGQFAFQYPRYRTPEEIRLSTFDRRFEASPESIHNDWLQLLVEGGAPALLLALLAAFLAVRRAPLASLGPLLAFAALAIVRSPFGNAPAAALAALLAGGLLGEGRREGERTFSLDPRRRFVRAVLLFGALLWAGMGQVLSQFAGAGMIERVRQRTDPEGQLRCVERALLFRPHDYHFRLLRLHARLQAPDLEGAARDAEFLLRTAPHRPTVQLRWAEVLRARGQPAQALGVVHALLGQDRDHVQARLLGAEVLVAGGDAEAAIALLYDAPHPRLRERLAALLGQLADAADDLDFAQDAALLRGEQAFVETLDEMLAGPGRLAAIRALERFTRLDRRRNDMRPVALAAALSLAQDHRAQAEELAAESRLRELLPADRALMREAVTPLLAIPAWRELLE